MLSKKLKKLTVKIANNKCTGTPIVADQKNQLCAGGEKGKVSCLMQGNFFQGIDKKHGRQESIEPIKRVFT